MNYSPFDSDELTLILVALRLDHLLVDALDVTQHNAEMKAQLTIHLSQSQTMAYAQALLKIHNDRITKRPEFETSFEERRKKQAATELDTA